MNTRDQRDGFLRFPGLDVALVFCLSLFSYTLELGQSPLAGTEGHRALTAHEMVQTGQYLLPHLFDQLYLKKPPLDYWIVAGFELMTGHANEWVWRFPSALAAAILAGVLCIVANRWFGKPAGIVAGLSHLALVAVWEQSRAADIDSMNSLFCVLGALGLIQLAIRPKGWLITIATGLAVGGGLMVKGPAGFTVIVGALIGPAIANRMPAMLLRFRPWLAMTIGLAVFAAYAVAVWHRCQIEHLQPDLSGLNEAADKSIHFSNPIFILEAMALPLILFVYSLPMSLAIPFCLQGPIWRDPDETRRRATRSIIGTLMVGSIVAILSGMINPRYAYVMLPLICLLAGAVSACRVRGELSAASRQVARYVLDTSAIAFFGLIVAAAFAKWKLASSPDRAMILAAAVVALCTLLIYLRGKSATALAGLIVLTSFPLAVYFKQDRAKNSAYPAAMLLAEKLPAGTLITCSEFPMDHPELFYYSKMRVESYPTRFGSPLALPSGRWVVLTRTEYAALSQGPVNALSQVTELWPERNNAYLAWYDARAGKP